MKIFVLSLLFTVTALATVDECALKLDLMRTDVEFSWMSLRRNRAEAFLAYMTDDALLLNRGVRGREAARENFEKIDPPGLRLSWGPTLADVSAAGDIGYTVGIWHRSVPQKDGKESAFSGMFCTVWRRQPDGTWKFACDGGAGMPDDTIGLIESSLRRSPPAAAVTPPGRADPRAWHESLLATDRGRSRDRGSGPWTEGLLATATDDVLFFEPAAHSREEAAKILPPLTAEVRAEWEPWTAEIAASGDLAFTWGTWRRSVSNSASAELSAQGLYLTVWKRQSDGTWKSVVQLSPQSSPDVIAQIHATAQTASSP